MRKPDQSLDDYIVRPVLEVALDPPRSVSLQRSGEVEVLKPLTREVRRRRGGQPLWFRRFLVAGSGAIVMVALVLVSAILVGIGDSAAGTDLAANETSDAMLTQPHELFSFDLSIPLTVLRVNNSSVRRRPVRPTIQPAVSKPRLREPLQPEEPDFVPTTLVIYAQNGVVMSRIEHWLQSSDR